MIASERRNKIIEYVNSYGSVRAAEIAKAFGVSSETIRKDLLLLNEQGLLKKKYGGAIAVNEINELPVDIRSQENVEQKNAIAQAALKHINDNNVIFVDSGSTLLSLAKMFPSEQNLAVVTNSFRAVDPLLETGNNIFFIGGEISTVTMSTSGFWTNIALSSLRIDVAFLGTSGFQRHNGPCCKTFPDTQFKMDVIKSSDKVIILSDSSKFKSNAVAQYATWEQVDLLITDSGAPKDHLEQISLATEVELI